MARRDSRTTCRSAQQAHSKVLAAQRELEAQTEEPIHRYVYSIPKGESPAPAVSDPSMTQALEQLQCQNQLLVDLLGAVNALTAALLCQRQ